MQSLGAAIASFKLLTYTMCTFHSIYSDNHNIMPESGLPPMDSDGPTNVFIIIILLHTYRV